MKNGGDDRLFMFICFVIFVFNNINVCIIIFFLYLVIGFMCLLDVFIVFVIIDFCNVGVSLGVVFGGYFVFKIFIRKNK